MGNIKLWWTATRPFAFTASVLPVFLGTSMAAALNGDLRVNWFYLFLSVLGAMSIHAATNLVNDYYDYKHNVDRKDTLGGSGLLVGKKMKPEHTVYEAVFFLLLSAGIGGYFVFVLEHSLFFLGLCLFGLFSGVYYTAAPLNTKYRALGDIQVFLSMGILMTFGSYYIQAQNFFWYPVLYAVPISLLVSAILHGNNLRDIKSDMKAGVKTYAIKIGEDKAKYFYYILVLGAYIWIIPLVIFFDLHPVLLISFLSLPLALKLVVMVTKKETVPDTVFALIDARTAQLHTAFGVLMTIGFILQRVVFGV